MAVKQTEVSPSTSGQSSIDNRAAHARVESATRAGDSHSALLALQDAIGNRAVARLLAPGSCLDRAGPRLLQRTRGTIRAKDKKKNVRLHGFEKGPDGDVIKSKSIPLPVGTAVELPGRTALSKKKEYTLVQYGDATGYVKSRYIEAVRSEPSAPARDAPKGTASSQDVVSDRAPSTKPELEPPGSLGPRIPLPGPKAGYELEFPDVLVLPREPSGTFSRQLVAKATSLVAQARKDTSAIYGARRELRDLAARIKKDSETPFRKRTVIFRAPHRTWAATTDTTLPGKSNLELVSAPLTAEEMKSAEAKADRRTLETVIGALKKSDKLILVPGDLTTGLVDERPEVVLINLINPQMQAYHVQITQATPLPAPTKPAPDWWLPTLKYSAMPILEQVVAVMKASAKSDNPKNFFGKSLPKTSVAWLLGTKTEKLGTKTEEGQVKPEPRELTDAEARWVKEMAKWFDVRLGDEVAKDLVESNLDLLLATGFTWEQFFTDLLAGTDRIADWSKTAFSGEEDLGYGTIADAVPDKWYVAENRDLGPMELLEIDKWLEQWAG